MFSEVIHLGTTSSTMDEAAYLIGSRPPSELHGTVIVADRQSSGRGRHGRRWHSSATGDLLVSFVFSPRPGLVASIPILGGLAASRAVDNLAGVASRIKWPNDVLVDGRKVAGVIAESVIQGDKTAVVLGVGMNLVYDAELDQDNGLLMPADNLSRLAGAMIYRDSALEVLCRFLTEGYERLDKGMDIIEEWKSRLVTLGSSVVVITHSDVEGERGNELSGTAVDVDELGRLIVQQDGGHQVAVSAGEVSIRSCE